MPCDTYISTLIDTKWSQHDVQQEASKRSLAVLCTSPYHADYLEIALALFWLLLEAANSTYP